LGRSGERGQNSGRAGNGNSFQKLLTRHWVHSLYPFLSAKAHCRILLWETGQPAARRKRKTFFLKPHRVVLPPWIQRPFYLKGSRVFCLAAGSSTEPFIIMEPIPFYSQDSLTECKCLSRKKSIRLRAGRSLMRHRRPSPNYLGAISHASACGHSFK